jgi:hypothetical protein
MRKVGFTCCLLLLMAIMSSCESMTGINISCLEPATYSFPAEIKRVGIVNNTCLYDPNSGDSTLLDSLKYEKKHAVSYRFGEGKIATEALANALANEKYFDEVVICDSALRAKDIIQKPYTLSRSEVRELADGLGVDAIISLENVDMRAVKVVTYHPSNESYEGTIDMKINPTVNVYIPSRDKPVFVINSEDSINWIEAGASTAEVLSFLPSDKDMIMQASDYAGSIPVKDMVPHWTNQRRVIFTDDIMSELKNAATYAKNNNWDEAFNIWSSQYNKSKNANRKLQMAMNIAVYYEMKNNFTESSKWLETARKTVLAKNKAQSESNLIGKDLYYYRIIEEYSRILQKRIDQLPILNAQTDRFNEEKKDK